MKLPPPKTLIIKRKMSHAKWHETSRECLSLLCLLKVRNRHFLKSFHSRIKYKSWNLLSQHESAAIATLRDSRKCLKWGSIFCTEIRLGITGTEPHRNKENEEIALRKDLWTAPSPKPYFFSDAEVIGMTADNGMTTTTKTLTRTVTMVMMMMVMMMMMMTMLLL